MTDLSNIPDDQLMQMYTQLQTSPPPSVAPGPSDSGTMPAAAQIPAPTAVNAAPVSQTVSLANAGGAPNEAVLKNLPPETSAQVKALAEGRMAFPAGFALKSPYWQGMISNVSQYDPSFDAINYNSRAKTRSDFTSGKSADNITALNTAIAHLNSLNTAYKNLGNTRFPLVNTVENYLGAQFNPKTQKNLGAVSSDATAVSHELAKVFRNSGMSEKDVQDWQNNITTNAAPATSKSVINSALDLMDGRLQALSARYNQGMGTTKAPLALLTPEAQKAYLQLKGGLPQQTANSNPMTQNQSAPQDYSHLWSKQ